MTLFCLVLYLHLKASFILSDTDKSLELISLCLKKGYWKNQLVKVLQLSPLVFFSNFAELCAHVLFHIKLVFLLSWKRKKKNFCQNSKFKLLICLQANRYSRHKVLSCFFTKMNLVKKCSTHIKSEQVNQKCNKPQMLTNIILCFSSKRWQHLYF